MKTNYRNKSSVFGILSMVVLVGALLFGIASPPPAHAQVTATVNTRAFVGPVECLATSTNLAASQLITNIFTPNKHIGIGVHLVGGASTNTGTVGLKFAVMYGGTNGPLKTTTTPIVATFTANGTTAVKDWYALPDYTLGPADGLCLVTITNAAVNVGLTTSSVIVSNAWIEYR